MNDQEAILKLYDQWKEWGEFDTTISELELKYMFLSSAIIGLTTYDEGLDRKFGKMIAETLVQIKNKTTFEYIEDENNYSNYILSCNFIEVWLDWGTSIRGAWFDYGGTIEPSESLSNVDYDKEYVNITEEFMDWFVDFISQ